MRAKRHRWQTCRERAGVTALSLQPSSGLAATSHLRWGFQVSTEKGPIHPPTKGCGFRFFADTAIHPRPYSLCHDRLPLSCLVLTRGVAYFRFVFSSTLSLSYLYTTNIAR